MVSDESLLSYRQLLDELGQLCAAQKSGTVLIATADNVLVRVLLERGQIISLSVGTKCGVDAVPLVRTIKAGRLRFSAGTTTGARETEALPPTDNLLALLAGAAGPADAARKTPATAAAAGSAVFAQLEAALVEYLGPMGSLIWQEQLAAAGNPRDSAALNRAIDAAAAQIGDPAKTQRFKEQARKLINRG
jgi:hypothetical protein